MSELLHVSSSPHVRSKITTNDIMLMVVIALLPTTIFGIYNFGPRALLLILLSVATCVLTEYVYEKLMKKPVTVKDFSAVVTGLLLALNLPVGIPLWVAIFGCFIAIVVVKQLFGGIGQNFANPAMAARVILLASFSGYMTARSVPGDYLAVDAIASATPLARMAADAETSSLLQMFLGVKSTCAMGEVSALALLIGGCYLVFRRVISPVTPLCYIGTVFVLTGLLGADPVRQILAGGLMLGAIFMATDYTTSPATTKGKVIFALGCGIITVLIRLYGGYPEGVSFAILLMNILTPQIDKLTMKKPLGGKAA